MAREAMKGSARTQGGDQQRMHDKVPMAAARWGNRELVRCYFAVGFTGSKWSDKNWFPRMPRPLGLMLLLMLKHSPRCRNAYTRKGVAVADRSRQRSPQRERKREQKNKEKK
jgi:hypothetical protein